MVSAFLVSLLGLSALISPVLTAPTDAVIYERASCPSLFSLQAIAPSTDPATYYVQPYRTRRSQNGEQGRVSPINFNDTFIITGAGVLRTKIDYPEDGSAYGTPRRLFALPQEAAGGAAEAGDLGLYFVNDAYFAAKGQSVPTNKLVMATMDKKTCEVKLSWGGLSKVYFDAYANNGAEYLWLNKDGSVPATVPVPGLPGVAKGYTVASKFVAVAPQTPASS